MVRHASNRTVVGTKLEFDAQHVQHVLYRLLEKKDWTTRCNYMHNHIPGMERKNNTLAGI